MAPSRVPDRQEQALTNTHDQHFFDNFMLILGILVGFTVGVFILARVISSGAVDTASLPEMQQEIDQRIAPVSRVALAGEEEEGAGEAAAVPAPPPVKAKLTGPQVYNQVCMACHATGIGGAPVFGDASAWDPRIAKGIDTLDEHALNGFQGEAGVMPPKGGRVDLSDEEIKAGVQYMVDQADK